MIRFEQQIEQGENEIDENEEDEEDEYEEEDAKYKPTAEGLISPELQVELEEFRKRIKERGEIARAEEAQWIAEEKKKPKKKRKGGVRFAEEPEEVPVSVPEPLPLPELTQTTEGTTSVMENRLAIGTNNKPEGVEKTSESEDIDANSLIAEDDEDARLQLSIAKEEARQSLREIVSTTAIDPMMYEDTPSNIPVEPVDPQLPKPAAREPALSPPYFDHTPSPSG